jgi:chromosomal replication initiator protein
MSSARRSRSIARPRQIAMYLAKNLTYKSLTDIGKKFGGKDHTTVMHAIKKIEQLITQDSDFAEDIKLLTKVIEC